MSCFVLLLLVTGKAQATAAFTRSDAPAAAAADWRFGVVESYEAPVQASTLGVAWTRVRFNWAEVQAGGPDTWTPGVSESQINGEVNAGRMVVGLLIGVPDWARDEERLPKGLALAHDDPGNAWANFVRQAVSRYDGRINHWVIWNEPDIADVTAPGHTWDGSATDFFQLQRVAYLVAKETNPDATVHLAAFTHFWDPGYFNRFLDVVMADTAAAENNYYFDVTTAHLYFQPNTIYDIIQTFYGVMGAHGIWKPIWLMETNAPPIDDPTWPVPNWTLSVTLDEQAAFVPQALASALAAGAQRIAIYKLKDTADDQTANPEPFGLIRQDGSRRPAFSTYRIAIQYLAGVTAVERERWDEVGQIRLEQADRLTTVLFTRLPYPQQAQVVATADTAALVDMWGTRQTVQAEDGFFRVELPPALCTQPIGDYCMIGGTTYYLVQATDGGAVPQAPPAPAAETTTAGSVATVSATVVADTAIATAAATAAPTGTATPSPPPATSTVTHTPAPTETPPPTATVTAVPTRAPTQLQPASTLPPTADSVADEPAHNLTYWFVGIGLLLALGLTVGWFVNGRRFQ